MAQRWRHKEKNREKDANMYGLSGVLYGSKKWVALDVYSWPLRAVKFCYKIS